MAERKQRRETLGKLRQDIRVEHCRQSREAYRNEPEASLEKHEVETRCGHNFEDLSSIHVADLGELTVFIRVFGELRWQALAPVY